MALASHGGREDPEHEDSDKMSTREKILVIEDEADILETSSMASFRPPIS